MMMMMMMMMMMPFFCRTKSGEAGAHGPSTILNINLFFETFDCKRPHDTEITVLNTFHCLISCSRNCTCQMSVYM